MSTIVIRNFHPAEAAQVDALALDAFDEYARDFQDWPSLRAHIGNMSTLANDGELIVAAEPGGRLVGAVVYVGPNAPKAAFFQTEWAVVRMLVVAPDARGQGLGRLLTEACLARATRDQAHTLALYTSALMQVALPMYLRMGFQWQAPIAPVHGVEYAVYTKALHASGR